ncbi:MAG TPA: M1 family metallopeptidase [Terriglobia bacterium]|nr:M1 family metallopeptidase [Terriglobia bacterium]
MPDRNPYLLPDDVEPTHYEIELQPDLQKFVFKGSESVSLLIRKPTSRLVLHALDLHITRAAIRSPIEGPALAARRMRWDKKKETVTLEFGKKLKKGPAELDLEFSGELNDKMHGFYRTAYTVNGEKRWGAATQFEATDARRCFPCWDEPARKATFQVALTVPESVVALSNMPPQQWSRVEPGWKRVRFEKTPRMPTYLLAFVIAELECLEANDVNGVPVRVWTRPGVKEQGRFALEQGCHTLAYFAGWFGIPYAFPKLDMVALPDFAAGAMENWGLVTYRETALLIDPVNSSQAARQRVAAVVDHELAHQWFGNYTTMQWWTDLWLNEGFASYMGPKATDHRFPSWDIWTQYLTDDYLAALHEDSLKSTHPVEVPVKNPHEIREVFDAISYSKGSVVNRMVEHYLGEDSFRQGLNRYLSSHAYGNARTTDLWAALEKVSGKPIKKMMAGYTRQPGYPVLLVKSHQQNGTLHLDLEQQRFLVDGSKDAKGLRWQIPVGVQAAGILRPQFETMTGRRLRLALNVREGAWVKLNPGQSGFYRTAYSEALWDRLIPAIASKALPTVDRLGLLDDAFALARAGYWKTSSALRVLEAYRSETDFSVWTVIAGVLGSLDNLTARERFHDPFTGFARQFFLPISARMGWEKKPNEGHLETMLRALAIRNLGGYGDHATIEEARDRFARYLKGGTLDPDLRQPVYSLVAENGHAKEWSQLRKLYEKSDLQEEKTRLLRAAGNCRDADVLRELLEYSLSEQVRFQDTWIVVVGAAAHPLGRTLAWKFVKKNWKTFTNRYLGGGLNLLNRIIGISAGFTSADQLADVEAFFKRRRAPGIERAVNKSLEMIRSNIKWLGRDRDDLRGYFRAG